MKHLLFIFTLLLGSINFAQAQTNFQSFYSNKVTTLRVTGTNTYSYVPNSDTSLGFVHAIYTADATVGNRIVVLELLNEAGQLITDFYGAPAITASQARHILYLPGAYRESAFDSNNTVQIPFASGMVIPAGYTLRVRDTANISAGDSMILGIQVR